MQLTSKQFGSARVVKLEGRIDHDNAEDFKAALQPYLSQCEAGGALVLDFTDVAYISSAGFRVLSFWHVVDMKADPRVARVRSMGTCDDLCVMTAEGLRLASRRISPWNDKEAPWVG